MKKKATLTALLLTLTTLLATAQYGQTPPLHVDGNQLKDPHGNPVVLHGVMDTPNPYFNNQRWGSSCSSSTITPCLNYFNKLFAGLTDTTAGAWCNLFRLHLDPCWTNDPNKESTGTETGEANISRFSSTRLRTYLRSLYFPIARAAVRHGMYVIMRPPGVFPQTVQVGDEYNEYLLTVWDIVSQNDSIKKYSGQISLELGNEPVTVLNADGEADDRALHDFFQPIVDKIRANGFTGIIWVPGASWQSNYRSYAVAPIEGYNIGYAVHDYVGWYGGDDTKTVADSAEYISTFRESVPVVDTNPIVITEVDWSPEDEGAGHYNEHGEYVSANYGTWATGTTSHWGGLYKSLLDHFGNISMTLSGTGTFLDIDTLVQTGRTIPAFSTAMQADGLDPMEASGAACWQWYEAYAQTNQPRPAFSRQWTADTGMGTYVNPLINADFPDPDIIRVDDTYYLATTTMFYFPGVTLLRSKDLINWEYCANPLQQIADIDRYNLQNDANAYAQGQWAPSLSYHNGKFIINFIAFGDGGGDFILTATDPAGQWEMTQLEGFYYDSGFLFDDSRDHLHGLGLDGEKNGTGGIYVVSGIGELTVTQLDADFKEVRSEKVLLPGNGCEGSHFYHLGDYYYIYSTYGGTEGSQTIFRSTDPFGPYEEHDGRVFANQHIHQGGIVETQTGEYWTILFKDDGTIGRIPYLEPVKWEDGWPVIGNDGLDVTTGGKAYAKPDVGETSYPAACLPTNDTFTDTSLGLQWQWNHNPKTEAWSLIERPGYLRLHTADVDTELKQTRNMLTQRIFGYNIAHTDGADYTDSYGTVSLSLDGMQEGDVAGICVFQDPYAYLAVKMEDGQKHFVFHRSEYDEEASVTTTGATLTQDQVFLRAVVNFGTNKAKFFYSYDNATWTQCGSEWAMRYTLNIFVGNRFGLFNFATKALGGYVDIDWFSTEPLFSESRYYAPSTLKTFTADDLTLTSLSASQESYSLTPGSSRTLQLTAVYQSGLTTNVASSCTYSYSTPDVVSVVGGQLKANKEGSTTVTASYTDPMGTTMSATFSATVSYFPLTADGLNPSISGTGTFTERTGALKTAENGFGGWEYDSPIDLSDFRYLVVKLRRAAGCSPSVRLFDEQPYASTPYILDMGTQRQAAIDLQQMQKEDGSLCDSSHLYRIGFSSTGASAMYIESVFLSDDGTTPTAIADISADTAGQQATSAVVAREYYATDGSLLGAPRAGITLVRLRHADGHVSTSKLLRR